MSALFLTAKQAASRAFHVHHTIHMKNGMLSKHFRLSLSEFAKPEYCIIRSSSILACHNDKERHAIQELQVKRMQLCTTTCIPVDFQSALLSAESRGHLTFRSFHASAKKLESKVVDSLEAIKDAIKKDSPAGQLKTPEEQTPEKPYSWYPGTPNVKLVKSSAVTHPSQIVVKLPLRTRIVNEIKHYYHGFRLLFIDVRVSARLIWAVLNGKTLMRRERKQLVRTTADIFRLVPFLVFVIVPFAEFLLPVVLKFFPGMLPSTFQEANKDQEKLRKRLKMKLEMAKFLQDTIEETALERKDGKGESVHDFVDFMNKIRTSGVQTSNEEILKFSKLFEDDITLDNLNHAQLRAMCQMLEITPVGPSYILRFQLEMKLRELQADDKMIQREGLDSMAVWELQDACRQRGMRSFGVPEERMRSQLTQWLDLHLNQKIPTSLLLLSRTLYFPEHISTEAKLKATILALPETLTDEAKVKISEVSGDRVDNKSKLEVIKQEEELIMKEKLELHPPAKEEDLADLDKIPVTEKMAAESLDHIIEKEKIHSKDLEHLEDALDMVVESKQKLKAEVEDLKNLKEEFSEYKESLGQLKGMLATDAPLTSMEESKAAKRLSKKVEKMISMLDDTVSKLSAEATPVQEAAGSEPLSVEKEFRIGDNVPDLSAKELLEKQSSLITITELLSALEKMQKNSEDSSKYEIIAKVLDADHDGVIEYNEALRFIELLGQENLRIDSEQMSKIAKVLKKEKEVLEGEKLKKQQEQQQAYHIPDIPIQPQSTMGTEPPVNVTSTKAAEKAPAGQPKKHL